MQTRSQSANGKYEVSIDFDGASAAWKANKKSIGNGQYKYICPLLEKVEQKQIPLLEKVEQKANPTFRKSGAKNKFRF
jgi:hypothetical protein